MPEKINENLSCTPSRTPKNGRLFIISAPSGTGKTTLCNAILKRFEDLEYSISHTTREPRNGEQNGIDYYFISLQEFKKNIKHSMWAEWAEVHGHFYGTSAKFLDRHLSQGHDILLDIDVNGTLQILKRYPDSITIFIMPPSIAALEERLKKRGSDSSKTIAGRLKNAETEMSQKNLYAHIITNDNLPEAIEQLTAIIAQYRLKR